MTAGCNSTEPRHAVVIVPFQHLVDRAGAFDVFSAEIGVLRRAGFRVELAIGLTTLAPSRRRLAAMRDRAAAAGQALGADAVTCFPGNSPFRHPAALVRIAAAKTGGSWGPATDLALAPLLANGRRRAPSNGPPDLVLCNYLSGLGLADRLSPRDRQTLILHDLPAGGLSSRLCAAMAGRRILCLNPQEAKRLAARIPATAVRSAVPPVVEAPAAFADLNGCATLEDVLAASGPSRPVSGGGDGTLDLLFVGGAHPPNVRGLSVFLRECFLPHLAPRGVTLAVAGSVCDALPRAAVESGRVFLLGRVERLRPLYAAARLAVIPLLDGTGVSMKLVEALAFRKPVLASPAGWRGFAAAADLALAPPFNGRWATAVETLLAAPAARREWRDRVLAAAGAEACAARFAAALGIASPPREPVPAPEMLVEWRPGGAAAALPTESAGCPGGC